MISEFKEINSLFKEIDETIKDKVHLFIIGGAMLLYHGMKRATKDIDIVVDTPKEFRTIKNTLVNLNFSERIPTIEYKKFDLNQIFIREDFRIDLFQRKICNGFVLSEPMMKRAEEIIKLEHLTISLCSYEDVFLLKTFTEREGDIDDCISLAKKGINWNALFDEIMNQIKISDKKVWVTWIGERLDILEEKGITIPIMNKLNKLREEYYDELEKKNSN